MLRSAACLLIPLLCACAADQGRRLQRRHGQASVREREVASLPAEAIDYWSQVRPIFEARCIVCHGCYDAPCQLKLSSTEGIDRGASKDRVYDALRLREAAPTRLFEDARSTQAWREKGFHPVLNERDQTTAANTEAGLLSRLLELKREHPLPPDGLLPPDIDLRLNHDEVCPTVEEFPTHARKHPDWGMPYGLPGLSPHEHEILTHWLEQGAVHTAAPPLPAHLRAEITAWETLLNGDSPRARLAARYVYEHLFLGHLHFDDGRDGAAPQFFELVRSTSPPGQPVERIATRRPYDDPGVARPYYRIVETRGSLVAKLHLPYRLDAARMQRWRELLFDADYRVDTLPGYAPATASNPFITFRAIPVPARYHFMLDEAEFTLMGFIKGSVCRGQIALNVIDDQFWIFFTDPDLDTPFQDAEFLHEHADDLRMPAASGSSAPPMLTWLEDAVHQRRYMQAKREALRDAPGERRTLGLDALWDGDGRNPNAALTVFRHFDSASVVKGMVGDAPKTAWVLDYALLERIHYLLVAGFDVFGNVGHQLATRTYMDFLRMESEFAFLAFLPPKARIEERDAWYRSTNEPIYREVVGEVGDLDLDTAISYRTEDPKSELFELLRDRMAPVRQDRFSLDRSGLPQSILAPLRRLAHMRGTNLASLPEVAFLLVPDAPDGARVFTLIHNRAHLNLSSPLDEQDRLVPSEDTLTVTRGFVGAYPNALFRVPAAELDEFVDRIGALTTPSSYAALQARFGIRRTNPEFWAISDRLHQLYRDAAPIEAGAFDLSRIENR